MTRALMAISGSAAALLPRTCAYIGHIVRDFWYDLTRDAIRPYHPEQHYMRGPGPAWRAKHDQIPSA
jgi:hypothetical protein